MKKLLGALVICALAIFVTLNVAHNNKPVKAPKNVKDTAGVLTATTGRTVLYSTSDSINFMDNPAYAVGAGLTQNPSRTFNVDSTAVLMGRRYGIYTGKRIIEWDTSFVPTSAVQGVGFTQCGFAVAPVIYVSVGRNTNTTYLSPQCSFKSISTTWAAFNLTEGNNNVLSALGITFLSGPGITGASDPSALRLHVYARGY